MRKIRELLRLKWACGYGNHLIAQSLNISSSTVSDCLHRAQKAALTWPLPDELDDAQLEARLYARLPQSQDIPEDIQWPHIHQELSRRKHVTLMLLWHEYKQHHPQGISYSQFCACYRRWKTHLEVWMRQTYTAGEKLFVDYAGQTMPVLADIHTGEVAEAQIFVGVLGASNFTYTEATWTQTLPDWIHSHVRMFQFFNGVPALLIPDNLKSGIHKAHLYEPDINPTYQDMAQYYGVAVVPARVVSPRDKAKVENGVLQVERLILAKLRHRTFLSLPELNQAMRPLLDELNQRPFQKLPGSRYSQFLALDQPALNPLPTTPYVYAEWKKVGVGLDYHIKLDEHYYSVPFTMAKKTLTVRYTQQTVEIFYNHQRIASHPRSFVKGACTTLSVHMPKHHQHQAEWTPERLLRWAEKIGPLTTQLLEKIMSSRRHPQQTFRSCIGILRLGKRYGNDRLEAACRRALHIGGHSYKSVESILKNGLDSQALPTGSPLNTEVSRIPAAHEYIRGQDYFNSTHDQDKENSSC